MLQILLDNAKVGCADITTIHHVSFDSFKFVIEQAIQALSQEPTDDATLKDIFCMGCEYREQEPCTDAVSRAALIGILKEKIKTHRSTIEIADKLIPLIEQLPSVTQKPNFCASCKNNTDNEICLECEYDGITRGMTRYESVTHKSGKWIEKDGFDGDVYYDCSVCGESWTTIEGTQWDNGMSFCPNCGARMDKE